MTLADELKQERDGQLSYGPQPSLDERLRQIFEFRRKLPSGHTVTSDGGEGEIVWRPKDCRCDDCERRRSAP